MVKKQRKAPLALDQEFWHGFKRRKVIRKEPPLEAVHYLSRRPLLEGKGFLIVRPGDLSVHKRVPEPRRPAFKKVPHRGRAERLAQEDQMETSEMSAPKVAIKTALHNLGRAILAWRTPGAGRAEAIALWIAHRQLPQDPRFYVNDLDRELYTEVDRQAREILLEPRVRALLGLRPLRDPVLPVAPPPVGPPLFPFAPAPGPPRPPRPAPDLGDPPAGVRGPEIFRGFDPTGDEKLDETEETARFNELIRHRRTLTHPPRTGEEKAQEQHMLHMTEIGNFTEPPGQPRALTADEARHARGPDPLEVIAEEHEDRIAREALLAREDELKNPLAEDLGSFRSGHTTTSFRRVGDFTHETTGSDPFDNIEHRGRGSRRDSFLPHDQRLPPSTSGRQPAWQQNDPQTTSQRLLQQLQESDSAEQLTISHGSEQGIQNDPAKPGFADVRIDPFNDLHAEAADELSRTLLARAREHDPDHEVRPFEKFKSLALRSETDLRIHSERDVQAKFDESWRKANTGNIGALTIFDVIAATPRSSNQPDSWTTSMIPNAAVATTGLQQVVKILMEKFGRPWVFYREFVNSRRLQRVLPIYWTAVARGPPGRQFAANYQRSDNVGWVPVTHIESLWAQNPQWLYDPLTRTFVDLEEYHGSRIALRREPDAKEDEPPQEEEENNDEAQEAEEPDQQGFFGNLADSQDQNLQTTQSPNTTVEDSF